MDSNHAVYEIPEAFSAMSLGVEVIKLHVRYCVYHIKCFLDEVHGEQ